MNIKVRTIYIKSLIINNLLSYLNKILVLQIRIRQPLFIIINRRIRGKIV